jgi:hypothetical protein
VAAAAGMNRGRDIRRTMPLIRQRTVADPGQLADDDLDLRSLAGATGS